MISDGSRLRGARGRVAWLAELSAVTSGDGRFVAVGSHDVNDVGPPDGVSWSEEAVTDILSADVAFGDTSFVPWGEAGVVGVSSNGIDWNVVPVDSVNRIWDIAFFDGLFHGSGEYDCCFGESPNLISYLAVLSPDGRAWGVRRRTAPNESLFDHAFGSGRFVAIGARAIFVSTDGLIWQ